MPKAILALDDFPSEVLEDTRTVADRLDFGVRTGRCRKGVRDRAEILFSRQREINIDGIPAIGRVKEKNDFKFYKKYLS